MQEKIDSFNAAFVDMAAGYVKHIANKMAGNTAYTTELPGGPLRYNADLAQLRVQQSFERRGRRAGKREGAERA